MLGEEILGLLTGVSVSSDLPLLADDGTGVLLILEAVVVVVVVVIVVVEDLTVRFFWSLDLQSQLS